MFGFGSLGFLGLQYCKPKIINTRLSGKLISATTQLWRATSQPPLTRFKMRHCRNGGRLTVAVHACHTASHLMLLWLSGGVFAPVSPGYGYVP